MLKQVLMLLGGLIGACEVFGEQKQAGRLVRVGELVGGMGKGLDQVNLLEVVRYFKDSKIAVKVSRLLSLMFSQNKKI